MSRTRLIHLLHTIPPLTVSAIVLAGVLWLTLAPQPVGDTDIPLFPGADKIAHAAMFGVLSLCFFDDAIRFHAPRGLSALLSAIAASLLGLGIECLQNAMELGRTFEWWDAAADACGAAIASILAWKWPSIVK